jgi:hypothetical protein
VGDAEVVEEIRIAVVKRGDRERERMIVRGLVADDLIGRARLRLGVGPLPLTLLAIDARNSSINCASDTPWPRFLVKYALRM